MSLFVPYVVRTHSTYGEFDSTQPLPPLSEFAQFEHRGHPDHRQLPGTSTDPQPGIQLGAKLPSGKYGTAINFYGGPSAGTPLDASLQPGTGSFDVIVGAYYYPRGQPGLRFLRPTVNSRQPSGITGPTRE